jgi:hypothetical protein
MFVETFHSTIKGIHLTLEVKTSFDNSTPAMGSSTEFGSQKEGKENLHTKSYKAKLERLRSARLARHDQTVKLLEMQRLQVVNDT